MGGEAISEDLNAFLRSKKIIEIKQELVSNPHGAHWCFCIRFMEDYSPFNKNKEKTDYKRVLDEESFLRFSKYREIRKRLSKEEGVPAFAIFTDEEMAELAKLEELTPSAMLKVPGIGEKKVGKYGRHFFTITNDEEG